MGTDTMFEIWGQTRNWATGLVACPDMGTDTEFGRPDF